MNLLIDFLRNNFLSKFMEQTCLGFDKKFKNYDVLLKKLNGYTCFKNLGSGSSGETFLFKKEAKKLTVKAMYKNTKKDEITNEVKVLEKIKNSCKNSLCHKKAIDNYIITEFIEGETMWDYYKNRKSVSSKKTFSFILQLFSGLEDLHSVGVIHFDIKPENIMISKNKLKIIDFGGAFYSPEKKQVIQKVYTQGYTPENIKKKMSFDTGVYVDYYCSLKSFRNDNPTIISPLMYVSNIDNVYNLFDTKKINIKNYRERVNQIKKIIS